MGRGAEDESGRHSLENVSLGVGNVHGHKRIVRGAPRDSARTLDCSTVGPPQPRTCITDAGTSSLLPCLLAPKKSMITHRRTRSVRQMGHFLDRVEILHDVADLGLEVAFA